MRLAVPLALLASFALNVTALVVPFMRTEVALKGSSLYTLPRSVYLLWHEGLFVLAAVVLFFSVAFPFVKLAGIAAVWFVIGDDRRRLALTPWIRRLGKWSYLDVFVVVITLVVSSDQFFVGAEPRAGLYLFSGAIAISIVLAWLVDARLRARAGENGDPHKKSLAERLPSLRRRAWLAIAWLVWAVAAAAFVGAVGTPFLKVSEFFLADNAFSVVTSVRALWAEGLRALPVMVAFALVAAPAARLLSIAAGLALANKPRWSHEAQRVHELAVEWSMLGVFALALAVFVTEGKGFVNTETRPGLYALVGAVAVMETASVVATRAAWR